MRKGNATMWLLIMALGLLPTAAWASTPSQSEHFPVAAPAAADGLNGLGDVKLSLKVKGLQGFSADVDLISGDMPFLVAIRVAYGLCRSAAAVTTCTVDGGRKIDGTACSGGTPADCCPIVAAAGVDEFRFLTVHCQVAGVPSFDMSRAASTDAINVGVTNAVASIDSFNCNNKNVYNDVKADIAGRVLLALIPNGINGTLNMNFFLQGVTNPKTASVANVATFANSQALATAMANAISGVNVTPPINAIVHPPADASKLSQFPATFSDPYFVEVPNILAVGITDVEMVGLPGQNLTLESVDPTAPPVPVPAPTLSFWGLMALMAVLLLSGYWLLRQRRGVEAV